MILKQNDDIKQEYIIAFVSKKNNNVESNHSSYKEKALVAIWAIAYLWPYLYRPQFTLVLVQELC